MLWEGSIMVQVMGVTRLAEKAPALPVRPPPWRWKKANSLSITRVRVTHSHWGVAVGEVFSKMSFAAVLIRRRRLPPLWRLHKTRT